MIATKDSIQPQSADQWPNSRRVYVAGARTPGVRVPFREIALSATRSVNGRSEPNGPLRVYDTSGSWGDPAFHGDAGQGLPPLRSQWILDRGDVEPVSAPMNRPTRQPLRAKAGKTVTQL